VMMALVIAAFGIAVSYTAVHFHSLHAIFGIIIVCGAVIQPILGIVADRMYNKGRTDAPWFPDRIHWIFGWGNYDDFQNLISLAILALALVNVELGLIIYGASQALVIAYGIFCAVVGAFLIAFAIYRKITGSSDN
jgi:hypothetical protein